MGKPPIKTTQGDTMSTPVTSIFPTATNEFALEVMKQMAAMVAHLTKPTGGLL